MNKNIFLNRNCPICDQKRPVGNLIKTPKQAENQIFEDLINSWNGFFKEKLIFSYARCNRCGLLYCPEFFTQAQLEMLYSQMPPNMDEVPKEALINTQYGYFKHLKQISSLEGAYLEIGPDIGLFTENCVREGLFSEYWLFEPNRDVRANLESVVSNKISHVVHEMTKFDSIPNQSISAAVMIHVMDHLLDPLSTLKNLRKKLKKDAHFLIVTHDESSILRKIFGWRWPAFCLQHPQIYNTNTTKELLTLAGYDVVAQNKTVNYFKISFLLKHALWAIGLNVKWVPSFFGITVGLKLGNILTIATPSKDRNE